MTISACMIRFLLAKDMAILSDGWGAVPIAPGSFSSSRSLPSLAESGAAWSVASDSLPPPNRAPDRGLASAAKSRLRH